MRLMPGLGGCTHSFEEGGDANHIFRNGGGKCVPGSILQLRELSKGAQSWWKEFTKAVSSAYQ